MITSAEVLPVRRDDLVIRSIGDGGRYVVKNPKSGAFFQLGGEEQFLLLQLDGKRDAADVCAAFEREFGQSLSEEDLDSFIEIARQQELVDTTVEGSPSDPALKRTPPEHQVDKDRARSAPPSDSPRKRQSLLYWRKNIFDPDRPFTWLEPKIRFFWTRGFVIFSTACILLAIGLLWTNREHVTTSFFRALRWETALVVWATLLTVTMLHESAHGLTCKHYGGEVHEIGFLMMFFMPCFYCNVSDAWLFPEKSKRLWVTFAGGYFELFLWSLAVFAWSVTVPESFVNYVSFIVLSACGVQSLFNFNPLLKLDGYYLLSDVTEIPNLRQRAIDRWQAHIRRWLWGAPRVAPEAKSRFLTLFGLSSWGFSLFFLVALFTGMGTWLSENFGILGVVAIALLGSLSVFGMLKGISGGEARQMIRKRRLRTLAWLVLLAWIPGFLCLYEIEDEAGGEFQLRSTVRAELRAPVAAFLRDVYVAEGDRVSPGSPVLRMEIPDLESRLAQKQAELEESHAQLRILVAGTRPEEIIAQRQRTESSRRWRDVVKQDLDKSRVALQLQLRGFDQQIKQAQAVQDAAEGRFRRTLKLHIMQAATDEQLTEVESEYRSTEAQLAQVRAEKQTVEARGVLLVETQLAEREKELSDHETTLHLMESATPSDEIAAQRARVSRLQEELKYLNTVQEQLVVCSHVHGIVTTPRYHEKVGQHFPQGELILLVEDPGSLEAEIQLDELSTRRVREYQSVVLKPRGLPLETIAGRIRTLSPIVETPEANTGLSSHLPIHCQIDQADPRLLPGMTGYARIHTGRRPIGAILLDRLLGHLRTEYWW